MADSTIGLRTTSDGKPIRLVDNGDGTYSLGVSTLTTGTLTIGLRNTSDGKPVKLIDNGDGSYSLSVGG